MKRWGNFENNGPKKLKVDENLDDLWGEDPDIDDIDDCLLLASQAHRKDGNFSTQMNNVSILPSYSFFKDDEKVKFSSTQRNNVNNTFNQPTTSAFKVPQNNVLNSNHVNKANVHDLESKFNKLQSQYEAKEGEVTILRTQLRTTKENLDSELIKRQKEWTEQLNISKKEMTTFAAELEFKKLEVANLKRKLLDVTKNAMDSVFNCTQMSKIIKTERSNEVKSVKICENNFQPIFNEVFPLKKSISENIFNSNTIERCPSFNSNHLFRNIAPYLQKEMTGKLAKLRPRVTMLNGDTVLKLDYIFPEISKLINCNVENLNREENNVHVNKIISVSSQFLLNFHEYLKNIGECTQKERIRQLDVEYLNIKNSPIDLEKCLFDPSLWSLDEEEIQCRQSIAVISEILPYNNYLRQYLTENKCLHFVTEENYIKSLDRCISHGENTYNFLNLIWYIVKIIGQYRKTNNYVGFLCAICRLLSRICECIDRKTDHSNLFDLVTKILKEIVFARPIDLIFYYLSEFLKNASVHKIFVQNLCNLDAKENLNKNSTKGIILINGDCCIFQIFSLLIRDHINNEKSGYRKYEKHVNILKFVSNAFNSNASWLAYQENVHSYCLFEINKLSIEIIYDALDTFINCRDILNENHETIIGCKNVLRLSVFILNILNFKSFEILERNSRTYSKYKYITKTLLEMNDIVIDVRQYDDDTLKKQLNKSEDSPIFANDNKLSELELWKSCD